MLYYVPWTQINNFSLPWPHQFPGLQAVSVRHRSPLTSHWSPPTVLTSDWLMETARPPLIGRGLTAIPDSKLTNSWPLTPVPPPQSSVICAGRGTGGHKLAGNGGSAIMEMQRHIFLHKVQRDPGWWELGRSQPVNIEYRQGSPLHHIPSGTKSKEMQIKFQCKSDRFDCLHSPHTILCFSAERVFSRRSHDPADTCWHSLICWKVHTNNKQHTQKKVSGSACILRQNYYNIILSLWFPDIIGLMWILFLMIYLMEYFNFPTISFSGIIQQQSTDLFDVGNNKI